MQWNDTYTENLYSYVNNIALAKGELISLVFLQPLLEFLNQYIKNHQLLKGEKDRVAGDDIEKG